jgi:hypothetical protein
VSNDDIGIPLANEPSDQSAIFKRWFQFPVVDIQYLIFKSEASGDLAGFCGASLSQWSAGHVPVTDVAIGDGHHFDFVSGGGPECGSAATFVFGIIGVCSEADDAERCSG